MNETVERLTDIIVRQARIINDLHAIVQQLNAATSLDAAVEAIQAEAKVIAENPE